MATRAVDPGAFVRPGAKIVSLVDRATVRMMVDVPENDFELVAPGKGVRLRVYATGEEITGAITRRAPAADPGTRTVHVEVDVPDPERAIPVGTTGVLRVDLGTPAPATAIPLAAATVTDTKSSLFAVDGDGAHAKVLIALGEVDGMLFVKPGDLPPGSRVVTQGRSLLKDGDRVTVRLEDDGPLDAAAALVP